MAQVLTTLEKVRFHLDLGGETDQDDLLKQIIEQVDEVIAQDTLRDRVAGSNPFSSVEGTEFYSGIGQRRLILRRRPVTAIARVAVDNAGFFGKPTGAFPVANDWVEGTDFSNEREDATEHNPGMLIALGGGILGQTFFTGGFWRKGHGNILVTYTAGYTTIPKDLELAATQLVAATWNSSDLGLGGPVDLVRLGDQAFRLLAEGRGPDMLHCRAILAKYKG